MKIKKDLAILIAFLNLFMTSISWAATYYPSPSCTDHSVSADGCTQTFLNAIGSTRDAILIYRHSTSGNNTTYSITASSITFPSNVTVNIEPGAILVPSSGKAVTVNGPFVRNALSQKFSGDSGSVILGNLTDAYPEDWGIDGRADDVEINKAIASKPNGGVIWLTQDYSTTAPVYLTANGQWLKGGSNRASKISLSKASSTIVGFYRGASSQYLHCGMENVNLYSKASSVKALDISGSSYGTFQGLLINPTGSNSIGIYGIGNIGGSAPYYNSIHNIALAGGGTGTAILFEGSNLWSADGCNGNVISNIKRINSWENGIDIKSGYANQISNVVFESVTGNHIRFNNFTADASGTSTSGTNSTLADASKSWTSQAYNGGTVLLTGGTGAGQRAYILSNTSNTLTVFPTWQTAPDHTTTYSIYKTKAINNTITNVTMEGTKASKAVVFDYGSQKNSVRELAATSLSATFAVYNSAYDNIVTQKGQTIIPFVFYGRAAQNATTKFSPVGAGVYGGYVLNKRSGYIVSAVAQAKYRGTTTARGTGTVKIYTGATALTKTLHFSDSHAKGPINTSYLVSSVQNLNASDGYMYNGNNLRAEITTDSSWPAEGIDVVVTVYVAM